MLFFHLSRSRNCFCFFFFFNDTATTEIYTLSLHDALPISFHQEPPSQPSVPKPFRRGFGHGCLPPNSSVRSEEHTSELQSQSNLVCRLLLEKKKQICGQRLPSHEDQLHQRDDRSVTGRRSV